MSLWNQIAGLVRDSGPSHVFELSEAGLAFAHDGPPGFEPFAPGTLSASPVEDNVLQPVAIAAAIERAAPLNGSNKRGSNKRRPAAIILPDYAARVTVLDFDSFPAAPEDQFSLVRFRVKKTIPFDVDSAAVSYYVQPAPSNAAGRNKIEVVAVTVALEVIARYEALFRSAGFHPGVVTTSALAALSLYEGDGVGVFAKLSGRVLTVTVLAGNAIKLFRCVALEESSEREILAVLHPTLAYVEDELGSPARKLILCGFPDGPPAGMNCEIQSLSSGFGSPSPFNAGLLGYLEAARA